MWRNRRSEPWSPFKKFIWIAVLIELAAGTALACIFIKYLLPWIIEFLRLNGVNFPS